MRIIWKVDWSRLRVAALLPAGRRVILGFQRSYIYTVHVYRHITFLHLRTLSFNDAIILIIQHSLQGQVLWFNQFSNDNGHTMAINKIDDSISVLPALYKACVLPNNRIIIIVTKSKIKNFPPNFDLMRHSGSGLFL